MSGWTPESCATLFEAAGDTLRPGGLALTEHLLNFGNFTAGSRILDAGCGTGATLNCLVNARQTAATGVDSSLSMLAAARAHSGKAPLVCAVLENLPFRSGCFDAVVCECVLSQTAAVKVLGEFHRVLCADGLLLVSDLYRRQKAPRFEADLPPDDDLATAAQTVTMVTEAGFSVEHWEDRSRDLRRLAVQLIMAPGPNTGNLFCRGEKGRASGGIEMCAGDRDLGYHLLVARKSER